MENVSNPKVKEALNSHYHFYMEGDITAGWLSRLYEGSDLTYHNSETKNFELNSSCDTDPHDNHGFPYFKACIEDQIKILLDNNSINRQ